MSALASTASLAVTLYIWLLIAYLGLRLLVNFGVINLSSPLLQQIYQFSARLVEPPLDWLRNTLRIPAIGGIDFTPLLLFFLLYFVQQFLRGL